MLLHPASATAQPTTTSGLLRLLGAQHACAEHHLAVIAQWLERNIATVELKLSLRANGYGRVLPRPRRVRVLASPTVAVAKAG